ncbi:hypothetical protein SBADM41S_11911 [Streptomyces badius]
MCACSALLRRHLVQPVHQQECPARLQDPARPALRGRIDHQPRRTRQLGRARERTPAGPQGAQGHHEGDQAVQRGQGVAQGAGRGVRGEPPQQRRLARARVAAEQHPGAVGEEVVDAPGEGRARRGQVLGLGFQAEVGGVQVPFPVVAAQLVQAEDLRTAVGDTERLRVLRLVPQVAREAAVDAFLAQADPGPLTDEPEGLRGEDRPQRHALDPVAVALPGHLAGHAQQDVPHEDGTA